MSGFLRPRNILIAGGVGVAAFALLPGAKKAPVNVFETPAVKSIGDRYSAGGGTNTHMPAIASKRGDADSVGTNQMSPRGAGTPAFERDQAAQKPGEPSAVGKAFNEAQYGQSKGK